MSKRYRRVYIIQNVEKQDETITIHLKTYVRLSEKHLKVPYEDLEKWRGRAVSVGVDDSNSIRSIDLYNFNKRGSPIWRR